MNKPKINLAMLPAKTAGKGKTSKEVTSIANSATLGLKPILDKPKSTRGRKPKKSKPATKALNTAILKSTKSEGLDRLKEQTDNLSNLYDEIVGAGSENDDIEVKSKSKVAKALRQEGTEVTTPAVVEPKAKRGQNVISNLNETNAMFPAELLNIREMLDRDESAGNMVSEVTISSIHRSMLKTSLDLVPIAEEVYRQYKNERACYAYSALINQVRELINDLRNSQDLEGQLQYILVNILQPAMSNMLRQLANEVYLYRQKMNDAVNADKALKKNATVKVLAEDLETIMRGYAKYLQESYAKIEADLRKYLVS